MYIPFGQWAPDETGLNASTSLTEAFNVLPARGSGYLPYRRLNPFSEALPAQPVGAFFARHPDGSVVVFAGTATKLFKLDGTDGSWDDVSQADTTYGATAEFRWRFAQFGASVVAVNPADDPQVFDLTSGTTFEDLGGSPPKARYVAVWGDFLVLAGLVGNPFRVQWSGLNDIGNWTPGTGNSDFQDFPDSGPVRGMTSSDNPLVFTENSIHRGVFQPGSPLVFAFYKLMENRGAIAPYSVVASENFAIFFGGDGFYRITVQGELTALSNDRIDRAFTADANQSVIRQMLGVIDIVHPRAYFLYRTSEAALYDRMLVYDWHVDKWTRVDMGLFDIIGAATPGFTLEQLDAFGTLETLEFSLDSEVWAGGLPLMAGFNGDNRLGFFDGPTLAARITTQEFGATDGQIQLVQSVMPAADTDDASVTLLSRMRRGESEAETDPAPVSPNTGICRLRNRGRFHRVRLTIEAGASWKLAEGVHVTMVPAGRR